MPVGVSLSQVPYNAACASGLPCKLYGLVITSTALWGELEPERSAILNLQVTRSAAYV